MLKKLILACSILVAATANAEKIVPVRVVIVEGSKATESFAWEIQFLINEWLSLHDLRVIYGTQKFAYIPDTAPSDAYTLTGFWMRKGFNWYGGVTWKFQNRPAPIRPYKKGMSTFYIPPIIHNGQEYGAGMAFGRGSIVLYTKTAVLWKMFFATLHEFLHTLGARDDCSGIPDGSHNIMCHQSVQAVGQPLGISKANWRRIRRAIRRL